MSVMRTTSPSYSFSLGSPSSSKTLSPARKVSEERRARSFAAAAYCFFFRASARSALLLGARSSGASPLSPSDGSGLFSEPRRLVNEPGRSPPAIPSTEPEPAALLLRVSEPRRPPGEGSSAPAAGAGAGAGTGTGTGIELIEPCRLSIPLWHVSAATR